MVCNSAVKGFHKSIKYFNLQYQALLTIPTKKTQKNSNNMDSLTFVGLETGRLISRIFFSVYRLYRPLTGRAYKLEERGGGGGGKLITGILR